MSSAVPLGAVGASIFLEDAGDFFFSLDSCHCLRTAAARRELRAWPGRTAMMWALRRMPERTMSPMISRILWRTNSSLKRRGSLLTTLSPFKIIAESSEPPWMRPFLRSSSMSS